MVPLYPYPHVGRGCTSAANEPLYFPFSFGVSLVSHNTPSLTLSPYLSYKK